MMDAMLRKPWKMAHYARARRPSRSLARDSRARLVARPRRWRSSRAHGPAPDERDAFAVGPDRDRLAERVAGLALTDVAVTIVLLTCPQMPGSRLNTAVAARARASPACSVRDTKVACSTSESRGLRHSRASTRTSRRWRSPCACGSATRAANAWSVDRRDCYRLETVGTGMTGPPGPVIPCTTLRAWPLAVTGGWPARCSPRLRSVDGRPRAQGGQLLTSRILTLGSPAASAIRRGTFTTDDICDESQPRSSGARDADLCRVTPHRNVHAPVGGGQ